MQAIIKAAVEVANAVIMAVREEKNPGQQCKANTNSTKNGWSNFETANIWNTEVAQMRKYKYGCQMHSS